MRLSKQKRARNDEGFTLVELLVSMTIFSVLMALILGLLITMMYQAKDNLGRQRAVEQARIGLSQIDRQVRSGNLILDPAEDGVDKSGVEKNYSLRIFTQEGGEERCVQWRVIFHDPASSFGDLEYREWEPVDPATVTTWSRVASNVVKPEPGFVEPINASDPKPDPKTWPPFWVDDSALLTGSESQNIRVTLRMNDPDARTDSKAQTITTVVTGRNTVFGYSPLTCNSVPTP